MYVISIKNGKVESMLQKGERKNDDKVGLSFFIAYEKEAGVSDLVFSEVEALTDVELPGVTITCSRDPYDAVGRCYKNIGDTFTKVCRFSGYQSDFCTYSYYVR